MKRSPLISGVLYLFNKWTILTLSFLTFTSLSCLAHHNRQGIYFLNSFCTHLPGFKTHETFLGPIILPQLILTRGGLDILLDRKIGKRKKLDFQLYLKDNQTAILIAFGANKKNQHYDTDSVELTIDASGPSITLPESNVIFATIETDKGTKRKIRKAMHHGLIRLVLIPKIDTLPQHYRFHYEILAVKKDGKNALETIDPIGIANPSPPYKPYKSDF
jgi:hypothetical protein